MSELKLTVKKQYLMLPVSCHVDAVHLGFYIDGILVGDADIRLDYENPMAYSYYPIGKYIGKELLLKTSPDSEIKDFQSDVADRKSNCGNFRPEIHFTAEYGWLNDPNGLVKYISPVTGETLWHMFYQNNPYDWVWGNMHWGHAVSRDLYHWEHLPITLYPDNMGTMFSGSAIVDTENRSGLKRGAEDVILLFYTAAGGTSELSNGQPFTQCLAFSTDGGKNFEKYGNNPIVPHIEGGNRDPKVIWCEEIGKFVMALYLDRNDYCLLTSDNFLDWEKLQTVNIDGEAECPDLYPLVADDGKCKWVFSGASGRYVVGEFRNGKFEYYTPVRRLYVGNQSYAAQTFSTYSEYERIQIAWDSAASFGDMPVRSQMSVPYVLSLKSESSGYVLCAEPLVPENCMKTVGEYENISLTDNKPFNVKLDGNVCVLDLEFRPEDIESDMCFSVFGASFRVDKGGSSLVIGDNRMELNTLGTVKLKLIFDKATVEVFGNGGSSVMTVSKLMNYNRRYAEFYSVKADISKLLFYKFESDSI